MNSKPLISVVVSVYGCAPCLRQLYDRVRASVSSLSENFELILVDDRSQDEAWDVIKRLGAEDQRVKGLHFSRNFGQHYAISAGLEYARGAWIVVMDCDLQDRPEEISRLYAKGLEGFDIVYAISSFRSNRGWMSRLMRGLYFHLYDLLTHSPYKTTNLSFFILSENAKNGLIKFKEYSRHISSLLRYIGFNIVGIDVVHDERPIGKTTYTWRKKIELAYTGILAYSSTLLKVSFVVGIFFSAISFLIGMFLILNKMMNGSVLMGWTSLMTLISFSTGLILISTGIIGIYIERIFLEVKNRPLYIVQDTCNIEPR